MSVDRRQGLDARVRANRLRLNELIDQAERLSARGEAAAAAVHAQVAAALAWHEPTGLFASPRLESILHDLGVALPIGADRVDGGAHVRTVLHVLTTAYAVGGHTRLAWRWMERDVSRVHSVVLTRQGSEPVPAALIRAVRTSGGQVHRVDRAAGDLAGRAIALGNVAARADVIVLHAHPYDAVPSMALAALDRRGMRPPTILLNHADHVFWVGIRASDLVLNLRASGATLGEKRRGILPGHSEILPLPLGRVEESSDRDSARRRLGLRPDEVMILTVASGYKFGSPTDSRRLLPILQRAISARPELRVMAVGPGGGSDWMRAERESSGRIHAFGHIADLSSMYGAADIYVDSYPFASLTSMLEAGQRRLPILSLIEDDPDLDVLGFDDPATTDLPIRSRTELGLLSEIDALAADPAMRLERGTSIAEALRIHEGDQWQERLESAYAHVLELHAIPGPPAPAIDPPPGDVTELDRRLLVLLDAQQGDAPKGVRGHLRFGPFTMRLEEWRRARRSDQPISWLVLLPESVLMLARRAGILARGLARRVSALHRTTSRGRRH